MHRAQIYKFGPFTLDRRSYRLLKGHAPLDLSPKHIDLLFYLVSHPSALATKEELIAALWPDVAVTDNALTQAVSDLRQALGDHAGKPKYIQTVARRGYRFVAALEIIETGDADEPSVDPVPRPAPESGALPAVAVTNFENLTSAEAVAWLASGIAETVTNDLRRLQTLRVVDRARVADAVKHAGGSLQDLHQLLGVDLLVVGSYQVVGDRLRITARVIAAAGGDTLAEAKADGALADVFGLQDRLVDQFASQLVAGRAPGRSARSPARETSSLEAYQAFTEGRLRLEALDGSLVPAAIADFERAVALDPGYAYAYIGLANAQFWIYEMSRARNRPDAHRLVRAIDYARKAIELDPDLGEAQATLSFLLVGDGRTEEALAAARRAVALDPNQWSHQFRLGHASWGEERLRALRRALELYPDFAYAHFGLAMVHVARNALEAAERVLRQGVLVQDRQAGRRHRFPARGLHWLLGMVRLARGDPDEAENEFEKELASPAGQLYAAEFTMDVYDGLGFARLRKNAARDALDMFDKALELYPAHARSRLGRAWALLRLGRRTEGEEALASARTSVTELDLGGRDVEAAMATSFEHVLRDRPKEAFTALDRLLRGVPPGFAGWTIPIEPWLQALHAQPGFGSVLALLAERAR